MRWTRRAGRAFAVPAVLAVAVASCSSGDGGGAVPTSTTKPAAAVAPPTGVLVPGGSITLGSADADVDASFEDGAFRFASRFDDRQLDVASDEGTFLSAEGIPLRCGDLAHGPDEPTLKERTKITGPRSQLVVEDGDGAEVTITAVSPAAQEVNPKALTGIPSGELLSSVLVSPELALRLADQPADDPLTVVRWQHAFDVGLTVEAELAGSLSRELSYRFAFDGPGEQGVSTNLLGIPCNERSSATRATPTASYQLVLLVGGSTLRVDGEDQTDTVADPAMQGSWAVAQVTAEAGTAKVEVLDRDGTRTDHWTLTYHPPGDL